MRLPKSFLSVWFAAFLFMSQTHNMSAQSNDTPENGNPGIRIGLSSSVNGSGAYYVQQSKFEGGFDIWVNGRASGDLGSHISWFFDIGVALLYARREYLGKYQLMASDSNSPPATADIYSEPLGYLPYTHRSAWGGFVFPVNALRSDGPTGWPDYPAIGFDVLCEIAGTAFDDTLLWRTGRVEREAAAMTEGSSLVLNKAAQPFFGIDLEYAPFPWFSLYSLTGILEYFDAEGISTSSAIFQNAYSVSMVTVRYQNYLQVDIGSSVVWPKRFELGYLFPLMPALLYQNNIGDFDNIGLFGNIKLQKPGLGFLWFSLFIDEMNFEKEFFKLDREMYAFQAGIKYLVPILPFSSVTLSYTKIEPYCYTHQKVKTPWYDAPVTEAYTNHGYGLGYYLPPNSDELKLAFTAMPRERTTFDALFQLVRHGADYGNLAVDGSSYLSELNPNGRSANPELEKNFLNDGAYQYQIIINLGIKHSLENFPLEFSAKTGMVFSFWTYADSNIDTAEYPRNTAVVVQIGAKVFY